MFSIDMTFKERIDRLEISVSAFARWSGFDRRAVKGWYDGKPLPNKGIEKEIEELLDEERLSGIVEWMIKNQPDITRRNVVSEAVCDVSTYHRAPRSGRYVGPNDIHKRIPLTEEQIRRAREAFMS